MVSLGPLDGVVGLRRVSKKTLRLRGFWNVAVRAGFEGVWKAMGGGGVGCALEPQIPRKSKLHA